MTQSNPWIGTWKLDPRRSEYRTDQPPRDRTTTYIAFNPLAPGEDIGEEPLEGVIFIKSSAFVDARGNLTNVITGPYLYDGKSYPVTGAKDYDASSYRRVDDFTYEATRTKDGKVVQTVVNVISEDGKTRTVTTTGVDLNGREINFVNVYDRQ